MVASRRLLLDRLLALLQKHFLAHQILCIQYQLMDRLFRALLQLNDKEETQQTEESISECTWVYVNEWSDFHQVCRVPPPTALLLISPPVVMIRPSSSAGNINK